MPELIDLITSNFDYDNFFSAKLTAPMTALDTDVFLDAIPTPSEGVLVIDWDVADSREIIFYNSKTASKVTCPSVANGRGFDDTTATTHLSGANVIMAPVRAWFRLAQQLATTSEQGWKPLGYTPNTVTNNGNGTATLVFNSVDLTSFLSPGMRLKSTRTVTAPTQCTDLEQSSSQYWDKSSPAGCTFTSTFTAMGWFKPESFTQTGAVIGRDSAGASGSGWEFYVNTAGKFGIYGRNASGAITGETYIKLRLNRWQHIAGSLNAASGASVLYLNGVSVAAATAAVGTTIVQASTNLTVGKRNSVANYLDGKLAQVAVFSSVLSAATILSYMNQGLGGSESTLISAYSFNGNGNDLNTTNANNLTAQGGAVATNSDSPFAVNGFGTPTGTTDYSVITGSSFSTNTTVTVQSALGNSIPTSGGVASMAYSGLAIPYGFPYQRSSSENIQSVTNAANITPTNSSQDLASSGLVAMVTVPTPTVALVTVVIGATSTADFEFRPEIRVGGTVVATYTPSAAPGNASSRAFVRSFTYEVNLSAGTNIISAGLFMSSAVSPLIAAGGATLTVLTMGDWVQ